MVTLRTKILLLFVGILGSVQSLTAYTLYKSMRGQVEDRINHDLVMGRQIFQDEFESRRKYLLVYSHVLSTDAGLLKAFSAGAPGLRAMVDAGRSRLGADLALVTDAHGRILASTASSTLAGPYFQLFDQMLQAPTDGSLFWSVDGRTYQVVSAPLNTNGQAGWLFLGFSVDDSLAEQFEAITSLKVSLLTGADGHWNVSASTLPTNLRIDAVAGYSQSGAGAVPHSERLAGETFRSLAVPLSDGPSSSVLALLQRSEDVAMDSYRPWWRKMLDLFGITMAITIVLGWIIARSLSRPLRILVDQARAIAQGNYLESITAKPQGELGELVEEFNTMQRRIVERESAMRYQADHDSLTGFANRTHFERIVRDRVQLAHLHGRSLYVVVLDLNYFNEINKTLGHDAGDGLLKEIGERIKGKLLLGEDAIARFNGDTFAVLLQSSFTHGMHEQISDFCDSVMRPYMVMGVTVQISAAIGVAVYPDHGRDSGTLIRHADIARHMAKERHLRYCIYEGSEDRYSLFRLGLVGELQTAIESGDLRLHYQPKLNLKRNIVNSVEALVRWQHPVHGAISPIEFIPALERTGNIHLLTSWAIHTSLQQAKLWKDSGMSMRVAVNVSAHDLRCENFMHDLRTAFAMSDARPEMLTLEITESALMEEVSKSKATLQRVRNLGVSCAIDDFGTGYSSMTQLRQLQVDEIKIDKSFVQNVSHSSEDELIVRSTIELAHNLRMSVTGEGVETPGGLDVLRQLGCDEAQGFYLSAPLAPAQFDTWFQSTSTNLKYRSL